MPYKVPYPALPDLGTLQAGDIVPCLRPAFDEGSASVESIRFYVQPYKKYVANLSQSGSAAPTAVVFENTLGETVTFSRGVQGDYLLTASGAVFTDDYTWIVIGKGFTYNYNFFAVRNSDTEIAIFSYDGNTQSDDILNDTAIEIRVYEMPPP